MERQNILRTLLFVVFFSIGTAVLSGSILSDDLLRYYQNKQLLKQAETSLTRLETLNADYDMLLQQLQEDTNLIKRIAPVTLGTEPEAEDTIYPKVTIEQLAAAREALTEDSNRKTTEPKMPDWVVRCTKPPQRTVLALAGAFLILISFIWFGPAGQKSQGR
jgi:hypothetical protein